MKVEGIRAELASIELRDKRLNRRSQSVLERLAANPQVSIAAAMDGWAETKAAYRLLDHERMDAQRVLESHYRATESRISGEKVVLMVQDTTELDFSKKRSTSGLGPLNYPARQGMYLHPTLALTVGNLPLGVMDAWMWSREKGSLSEGKDPLRPIEEKESFRWLEGYRRTCEQAQSHPQKTFVYIADREADIYELFAEHHQRQGADEPVSELLIRATRERNLSGGGKLKQELGSAPVLSETSCVVPARRGRKGRVAKLEIRAQKVSLKAPYRRAKKLPDVELFAVLITEIAPPKKQKAIEWLLLTTFEVSTAEQALELIDYYSCRWTIEVFFYTLKSGCKLEELGLQTDVRLEAAVAFYLIIAWRLLFLTRLGRSHPRLPADVVFAQREWAVLYVRTKKKKKAPKKKKPPTLRAVIRMIAGLGGFLGRKSDGEPGVKSLWIGLRRAADITLGAELFEEMMQNG